MEITSKGKRLHALPFLIIETKNGTILKRGITEFIIKGETALETLLVILMRCADEGATIEEICDQFALPFREDVFQLISDLIDKRLIVSEDFNSVVDETNADLFYWQFGTAQAKVISLLSDAKLVIAGINTLGSAIYRSLYALGVKDILIVDDPLLRNPCYFSPTGKLKANVFGPGASIISRNKFFSKEINTSCIIATSEYGGQGCLLPLNERAVQQGYMFIPVYLQDMVGYMGPLVIPGETACLQCLRMRQNAHLHDADLERQKEEHLLRGESIAAIHPSMITVVAETTVFEICHFIGGLSEPRPGNLIRIDMVRGMTEQKRVLKIPRCPVCSNLVKRGVIRLEKSSPMPE